MNIIKIYSQKDFDDIPNSLDTFTRIEVYSEETITVNENPKNSVLTFFNNSRGKFHNNSRGKFHGNSRGVFYNDSRGEFHGNSRGEFFDNSRGKFHNNSRGKFHNNSRGVFYGNSRGKFFGNSSGEFWDNSRGKFLDNSSGNMYLRSTAHNYSTNTQIKGYDNATIYCYQAPKELDVEKTVNVIEKKDFIILTFDDWINRGWVVADGITQELVSQKKIGEITILKTKDFHDNIFYVARKGNKFAHAKTIDEAKNDLRYKISDRDTTKYKSWKINDKKHIDEMIEAYRVITGACSEGTKMFCEGKDLKEYYTPKEVIDLTDGSFGNNEFRQFFEG